MYFPFQISTFLLRPANRSNLSSYKFGEMPPHENFEIFNAKSFILSISERVLMFEKKLNYVLSF
jgi:hypothetical protein